MTALAQNISQEYAIDIAPLDGKVRAWRGKTLLAESSQAKVMYETRLPPAIYFPVSDVHAPLSEQTPLQTFCPFKGTASYRDLNVDGETYENAVWSYETPKDDVARIKGYLAFYTGDGITVEKI